MSLTAVMPATIVRDDAEPRAFVWLSSAAFAALGALVVIAPFERTEPLVRLRWQSVSSVEAAVGVALTAIAVAVLAGALDLRRSPLVRPWLAWIAVLAVASAAAPANRVNAAHLTARVAIAFALSIVTATAANDGPRRRRILLLSAGAGLVVATLAILEYAGVPPVLGLLRAFRPFLSVIGAQVRAGGSLQYPTIASMYLELVFAFLAGLMASAADRRQWRLLACTLAAMAVVSEAVVVTFTRTGLVTMLLSLGVVSVDRFRSCRWTSPVVRAAACLILVLLVQILTSRSLESTRLRLTSEVQDAWYQADIVAPRVLTFGVDETRALSVMVTNTGRVTWDSDAEPPIRLSYHWVLPDDRVVAYEGIRTEFPRRIEPGETLALTALVRAPQRPGRYRLLWDIAEEGRRWFSTEPDASLVFSEATVEGDATGGTFAGLKPLPRPPARRGRIVLWRAAFRMLRERPWLGIGPDNYRLSYGPYANLPRADPRVHTNNMYLDILAGAGVAGGAAFLWVLHAAVRVFREVYRRSVRGRLAPAIGLVAAGLAFLVHGLVDSFLSFTPIYVMVAVTIGLAVAVVTTAGESDAHRV